MTAEPPRQGCWIRVRGLVQGVGFRPSVWRLANDCGIQGEVYNDSAGVVIRAWGAAAALDRFCRRLREEVPPLARIDAIEQRPLPLPAPAGGFSIGSSQGGVIDTGVVPDAATCPACLEEVLDPDQRRYRYPFTNCTHCGPRFSILRAIPYDRPHTSMAVFRLCPACNGEYQNPADRRFHAQPIACPACGPRVWLEDAGGRRLSEDSDGDSLQRAAELIRQGAIVAIKGLGGFHVCCDGADNGVVETLRRRKRRDHKPFALMARDLAMVRDYAVVDDSAARLLQSPAGPIVVLPVRNPGRLAAAIAPGRNSLGFMLPYTPLHHLLMEALERPVVLTSGNRSEEPQCIDNASAKSRLAGIADYWLLHDRVIVNRVDDSVLRVMDGHPRMLRRARGYAPAPLPLPPGFAAAPPVLALGAELKNTFCLIAHGQALVSPHIGDLEQAETQRAYRDSLELFQKLYRHRPEIYAIDRHPDYLSSQYGSQRAEAAAKPLETVQHHHAHIASCMAEHAWPLDGGPVLGIALDGLGYGDDGGLWGGEFLKADYFGFQRVGHLQPVPLPGGIQALREPWRNTWAHLVSGLGWDFVVRHFPGLELVKDLQQRPLALLEAMQRSGLNCPPSSSCGRLFDAVAAALGLCRDRVSHEGQAAMSLEALAAGCGESGLAPYPCAYRAMGGMRVLDWAPLWRALLDDLQAQVPRAQIAVRFHLGVAEAIALSAAALCRQYRLNTVVLGGGVFQNKFFLEALNPRLRAARLDILSPRQFPANDGGLSLGQGIIAAARALRPGFPDS